MMRSTALLLCVAVVGAALVTRHVIAEEAQRSGVLTGVVRDPAGKPVPAVWIAREGHRDRAGVTPWWRTDVEGRFRIEGLPEGEVVLRVVPGDATLFAGTLVRTSARTDVPVVVEPGPELFLRIADYVAPKDSVSHARVTWVLPDGRRPVRYSPIAPDGRIRFIQLPADATLDLWASAGPGKPVRVAAVPGLQISGKVLVAAGDSPRRAAVVAEAYPHFSVGRVTPAADGSFVITDLPEGTYRMVATFTSGEIPLPVATEVRAGASDVVFDLRR
jgi:hypothetical protein